MQRVIELPSSEATKVRDRMGRHVAGQRLFHDGDVAIELPRVMQDR